MFGRLNVTVAGIAVVGLLAVGAPASAAPAGADTAAVGAGSGQATLQQRAQQERQLGARDASQLVQVKIGRSAATEMAPLSTSTTAASPYVVWVQNQTSVTLTIKLYWAQSNLSAVQQMTASLNGGATAPYNLGGSTGCSTMLGYILEIWYQGAFYAATGTIEPSASDGYLCSDYWGVA